MRTRPFVPARAALSRVRSRWITIELREAAVVPWTHGQYESGPVARLCRRTVALNDLRALAGCRAQSSLDLGKCFVGHAAAVKEELFERTGERAGEEFAQQLLVNVL